MLTHAITSVSSTERLGIVGVFVLIFSLRCGFSGTVSYAAHSCVFQDTRSVQEQFVLPAFHDVLQLRILTAALQPVVSGGDDATACYVFSVLYPSGGFLGLRWAIEATNASTSQKFSRLHLLGVWSMEHALVNGGNVSAIIQLNAAAGTTFAGLGGPLHGAVWHYIMSSKWSNAREAWEQALALCQFYNVNAFIPRNCLHGFGHGITFRVYFDEHNGPVSGACRHQMQFGTSVLSRLATDKAIDICRSTTILSAVSSCLEGSLMSYTDISASENISHCDHFSAYETWLCVHYAWKEDYTPKFTAADCGHLTDARSSMGCQLTASPSQFVLLFSGSNSSSDWYAQYWTKPIEAPSAVSQQCRQLFVLQEQRETCEIVGMMEGWFISLHFPALSLTNTSLCAETSGRVQEVCKAVQFLRTASFCNTLTALAHIPPLVTLVDGS